MKGVCNITGMSETVDKLMHMYGHCLYRFELDLGCDECRYNNGPDDNCALLRISDDIRKSTKQPECASMSCAISKIKSGILQD